MFPTSDRAPRDSRVGRRDSAVARSRPFFSSLERIPYSAVSPRRSSSRIRLTALYYKLVDSIGGGGVDNNRLNVEVGIIDLLR